MEAIGESSVGGLIVRFGETGERQVLLIRVRKHGYELPKGHIEPGETEAQAALRECIEEVGVKSTLEVGEKLETISYSFMSRDKKVTKTVSYYLITCADQFACAKPRRTRELLWIGVREIDSVELVNDNLRRIIRRALDNSFQAI